MLILGYGWRILRGNETRLAGVNREARHHGKDRSHPMTQKPYHTPTQETKAPWWGEWLVSCRVRGTVTYTGVFVRRKDARRAIGVHVDGGFAAVCTMQREYRTV